MFKTSRKEWSLSQEKQNLDPPYQGLRKKDNLTTSLSRINFVFKFNLIIKNIAFYTSILPLTSKYENIKAKLTIPKSGNQKKTFGFHCQVMKVWNNFYNE